MHDTAREEAWQAHIRDAVRIGDDDLLAALVQQLHELRLVELRRALTGLEGEPHALRRVAEVAFLSKPDPENGR